MPKRIKISYETNPAYRDGRTDVPRLFASIDLGPYGAEERVSALPIRFRSLDRPLGPVRQVYSTTIAGLPIEKGNLTSLEKSLDLYLGALVHFGRVPLYFFRVGQSAWPIYRLPDKLVTRYPGSPVFSADSVGDLRHALADNFKRTGQIRNRKEVQVLALSRHDLQLYRPLCVFRAEGISDIPVFPLEKGKRTILIAPVNARALSVPLGESGDLLRLHEAVAGYMCRRGVVDTQVEVTVRKLTPATWHSLRTALVPAQHQLVYHEYVEGRLMRCEVPLYRRGSHLLAARTNSRQRTALHVGPDLDSVKDSLGEELYREQKISSPQYLTMRSTERNPGFHLESATIQYSSIY